MLRTAITLATASLAIGVAAPATAARSTIEIDAILTGTVVGPPEDPIALAPGNEPGSNWRTPPGSEMHDIWHVRKVPVFDVIESLDTGETIGYLDRSVSFDWDLAALADGVVTSTARCSYDMNLEASQLGTFSGHCAGDLLQGMLTGTGDAGHQMGTYALAAGGTPGVGPYLLHIEIAG